MPSQLKQLKAELSKAGLARQSQPGSSKKRKRAGTVEQDRDKQQAKLQNIHDRFNQFDTKVTKLKHDVIGRKLKGVTGKPTMSKQAGIELRKKTLLVEHSQRHHAGGVVDRRFGEDDPDMTPEERMQERFTKERQRAAKLNAFALDDDEELTHYGQSLSKMDDFDATGLTLDDDEADATIDRATVARDHFGGFEEDEEDLDSDGEPRKKTKAEVMAEVIAKSKEHKYLRQQNQEKQESERMQLDDEFDSIRALLGGAPADSFKPQVTNTDTDKDYDQLVRDLFFDKRSKPSDRTKTEDELAVEEKTKLEKLERARLRRMRGDVEESEDEDEAGRHKKRRRREKGGDDLEDDFMDEDEVDALNGLGAGLAELADAGGIDDAAGSDEEDQADDSGDDEDGSGDESDGSGAAEDDSGDEAVAGPSTKRPKKSTPAPKELPYTFPCPASHEELLDILENVDDANVPTVIQRIRTLYHPSLGVDNTAKLQTFCGVLVDHILYAASPPEPNLALVHAILPHVTQLSQKYPMSAAEAFVAKLKLMNKNLNRGLSNGPTSPNSKTWPGTAELMLLRTIGTIWSTSDKTHVVVGPARLLIASYLGLARVRSLVDIASGLFLCTLVLQYEHLSQRFVPEVVNFLFNAVLHLAPHSIRESEKVPGSFPCPDFMAEHCPSLRLGKKAKSCEVGKPDFVGLLAEEGDIEQKKVDLLACTLDLLTRFAEVYKGLDGFVELFSPLSELLAAVQTKHYSTSLKTLHDALVDRVTRLLKFSLQARRPLRLQAHKAIAIPTYIPKFTTTGGSSYLRAQDPDRERAEASKLRRQYKEERKGAIKELRKDAKFMAGVVHQQQEEKDRAYKDRMKRVHSSLEGERAEEKAMEREKSRSKKRAGGKK
ncbi:Nop14-like protein [Exidia glandulosa HHB12029]|uniref:Nop14-like protein n=1 Tax=Exidia glandulosa HHB12029 TaxID=1314781 RepID=A0A165QWJ6_EXIGL|nr:Nop14-like protein [Exidia glandulosa HHB12029]